MVDPTRTFHLGDILTITTGRLVSPTHMQGVHEILDFLTGDTLFTHQLPRACDEAQPELLRQHPDLVDIAVPGEFDGVEHVGRWLAEQVARFGETREVSPLRPGDHTVIDPIAELRMMRPDVPIIVVQTDQGGAR
jgi:hypothetical protein